MSTSSEVSNLLQSTTSPHRPTELSNPPPSSQSPSSSATTPPRKRARYSLSPPISVHSSSSSSSPDDAASPRRTDSTPPWRSALGRSFFLLPTALDYLASPDLFSSRKQTSSYMDILQETFAAFSSGPIGGLKGDGGRWEGESWTDVDRFLDLEASKARVAWAGEEGADEEEEEGGWVMDSAGDPTFRPSTPSSAASSTNGSPKLSSLLPPAEPSNGGGAFKGRTRRARIEYDLPSHRVVGDHPEAEQPATAEAGKSRKKAKRLRLKDLLPPRCVYARLPSSNPSIDSRIHSRPGPASIADSRTTSSPPALSQYLANASASLGRSTTLNISKPNKPWPKVGKTTRLRTKTTESTTTSSPSIS